MAVHNFDTNMAKKYGIPEAVVLWNISYWQNQNEANDKNFHDGRYWTYNTVNAYSELFGYLSPKQISRILLKLESEKAIVSGNYNKFGADRTKWYSVEPNIMELLGLLPKSKKHRTDLSNASDKSVQSNLPNGKMEFTKKENAISQMGRPIPNNKPNNKPDNKTPNGDSNFQHLFSSSSFSELFSDFLKMRTELKAKNSKRSENIILKKIEKLSEGKLEVAIGLVEQSIENSWKGIFPLKNGTSFPFGKDSAGNEQKSLLEHNTKIAEEVSEALSKIDYDAILDPKNRVDPFA